MSSKLRYLVHETMQVRMSDLYKNEREKPDWSAMLGRLHTVCNLGRIPHLSFTTNVPQK